MNNEYIPLYFPGFENYPKNKSELIIGLEDKIKYCESNKEKKEMKVIGEKIKSGLKWLKNSVKDRDIPSLKGLDYYRLGVTYNNVFSVQVWSRINEKEKISYKKKIILISKE